MKKRGRQDLVVNSVSGSSDLSVVEIATARGASLTSGKELVFVLPLRENESECYRVSGLQTRSRRQNRKYRSS